MGLKCLHFDHDLFFLFLFGGIRCILKELSDASSLFGHPVVVSPKTVNDYASLMEDSPSLMSRFMSLPSDNSIERKLVNVTIKKVNGSIGILLSQGSDGSFYIRGLTPGGPAEIQGTLQAGKILILLTRHLI